MRIGFIVTTAPYTFQNTDTALSLIEAALDKGHTCDVFLYMDGVIATSNNIKPGQDRSIPEKMTKLMERGVRFTPCGVCCNYRGVKQSDTIPGIKQAGIAALGRLINECDRTISLGF
ncbi:MAG: DsrE family protein [Caldisericia bacterium]|nr:DsrE family protein [Caldisericia bacterium]